MSGEQPIQQVQVVQPPKPSIEERLHAHRMRETQPEPVRAPDGKFAGTTDAPKPAAEPGAPEPAPAAAADATPEPATDDAVEISTINELADHLGVDVADLYANLKIKVTTADGQPTEVALGEWKDGYQANDRLTRAQQALERERAEWTAKMQAAEQQAQAKAQQAESLIQTAWGELQAEYQATDWNTLRYTNPGEYAAKQAEMQARQNRIAQAAQQLQAQRAQDEQRSAQEREARQKAELAREGELLLRALPEWKDPVKADAERQAIRDYLMKDYGYSEQDVGSITSHKLVTLVRKAMLFDKLNTKAVEAKKAAVRIGKKVLTPSARTASGSHQQDAVAAARAQLSKSGNVNDAAALLGLRRKK